MGPVLHSQGANIPNEFLEAMAAAVVSWHEALKQVASLERQLAERDEQYRELLKRNEQLVADYHERMNDELGDIPV